MRITFLILLFMSSLFCNNLLAQPYRYKKIYEPKQGKRTGHYVTNAKNALKNKKYNMAIANTAKALQQKKVNKRQMKKLTDVMTKGYSQFLKNHQLQIDTLKLASKTIETDLQVNQRHTVTRLLKELMYIKDELMKISDDRVRKIGFSIDKSDHTNTLNDAESFLKKGEEEMTEIHYVKAKEMMDNSKIRSDFKAAGFQLIKVQGYNKEYKDVSKLFNKTLKKGMTKISVHAFDRSTAVVIRKMKNAQFEHEIFSGLFNKKNHFQQYPYIDFFPNDNAGIILSSPADGIESFNSALNRSNVMRDSREGVHYKLTGVILRCTPTEDAGVASVETVTKTIKPKDSKNKDDPGIKVSAELTTYYQSKSIKIEATFSIVDIETGKISHNQSVSGYHSWRHEYAIYKGDKRALSSWEQSLVELRKTSVPIDETLISDAEKALANDVIKGAFNYISSNKL